MAGGRGSTNCISNTQGAYQGSALCTLLLHIKPDVSVFYNFFIFYLIFISWKCIFWWLCFQNPLWNHVSNLWSLFPHVCLSVNLIQLANNSHFTSLTLAWGSIQAQEMNYKTHKWVCKSLHMHHFFLLTLHTHTFSLQRSLRCSLLVHRHKTCQIISEIHSTKQGKLQKYILVQFFPFLRN